MDQAIDGENSENGKKEKKNVVGYVCSKNLCQQMSKVEKIENRSLMLHSLLFHTGLLKRMKLYEICSASLEDLSVYHSQEYLAFLSNPDPQLEEEFGCVYDCPVFDGMEDFGRAVASGSLTAARLLVEGRVTTAINWSGGWHHARRDSAAGFCYVNDIVLAIHKLQFRFKRILYIDLDVHHGDAVEDAFSSTSRVMTLSFHKLEAGFFPGSGDITDLGYGKGKYYSVNVPLKQGMDDSGYCQIFDAVFKKTVESYSPDAIVVQCGVDGLVGDPHGGLNLTPAALSHCVLEVVRCGLPCLLLGGGGYNIPNSVRCWTKITADLLNVHLPEEIPDTDPYFLQYGPDFTFNIEPSCVKNYNTEDQIKQMIQQIETNLLNIKIKE